MELTELSDEGLNECVEKILDARDLLYARIPLEYRPLLESVRELALVVVLDLRKLLAARRATSETSSDRDGYLQSVAEMTALSIESYAAETAQLTLDLLQDGNFVFTEASVDVLHNALKVVKPLIGRWRYQSVEDALARAS